MGLDIEVWCEIRGFEAKQHPNTKIIQKLSNQFPPKLLSFRVLIDLLCATTFIITIHPKRLLLSLYLLLGKSNKINIQIFLRSLWLAYRLRNHQNYIIYAHDSRTTSLTGIFLKILTNNPLIVSIYTYELFAKPYLLTEKLRFSNRILFQSNYSKLHALKVTGGNIYEKKCIVIATPGVDVNIFSKKRKYRSIKSVLTITTVARLESSKNISETLRAIKYLSKKMKIVFHIIGSGSQESSLKILTKLLKLQKFVKFHGVVPHGKKLRDLYHLTDIFVLCPIIDSSGDRDMQPNVIKEAMATGTIVLTSNMGGINELITHKYNGFITNKPRASSIAYWLEYINKLSTSEKQSLADQAYRTIIENHSNSAIMKEVYSCLLRYDSP